MGQRERREKLWKVKIMWISLRTADSAVSWANCRRMSPATCSSFCRIHVVCTWRLISGKKQKQKWREWKSRRADLWVGDARWRERHLTDNRCVMLFGQYEGRKYVTDKNNGEKRRGKKFRGNEQCHQRRYRALVMIIVVIKQFLFNETPNEQYEKKKRKSWNEMENFKVSFLVMMVPMTRNEITFY